MRRWLLALFFSSCLPADLPVTPPSRFGIYEPASVLEPNEYQFSVGHAQPIVPTFAPEGQSADSFLELDARLRKGLSKNVEAQVGASSLFDFKISAGRVGIKYALPGTDGFHWALAGGAALGYNGSGSLKGVSTTRSFYGSADAALMLSGPRYWRFSPYGALGIGANATGFVTGTNADGVKEQKQAPLFTPHATAGVDMGFHYAHLLFEVTPLLAKTPEFEAIPNFLVAGAISFSVGKVRYLTPKEKALPKESDLCEVGKIEVDEVCYTACVGKLNRCPSTQVCVISGGSPKCITGVARVGTYVPEPDSEPTSTSQPATRPAPEPESAPAKPQETRDALTICLAKDDGVSSKERLAVCQRYIAEHPNDPSFLLLQGRIIELQRE